MFSDTYSAILSGAFLRCILCRFLSSMTSGPNRLLSLLLRHGGRVPGTSPRLLISQYGTQADRHPTASTAGEEKAKMRNKRAKCRCLFPSQKGLDDMCNSSGVHMNAMKVKCCFISICTFHPCFNCHAMRNE